MQRANIVFYSTLLLVLAVTFYVYGYSTGARECQAKGGIYAMDFGCNKITITPIETN